MMKDEPAFPTVNYQKPEEYSWGPIIMEIRGGLSKREYFAGLAMQGLLAAVYSNQEMLNEFTTNERGKYPAHITGCQAVSENAIHYADALIKALGGGE